MSTVVSPLYEGFINDVGVFPVIKAACFGSSISAPCSHERAAICMCAALGTARWQAVEPDEFCEPLEKIKENNVTLDLNPCGLIANSMFNGKPCVTVGLLVEG